MREANRTRSLTRLRPVPRRECAGGALLVSLILVTLVAGMGAVMIRSHLSKARGTAVKIDSRRAFYAAEAGLSEAMLSVAQGKSGAIGSAEEPAGFAGSVFWVEAEESEDQVTLKSTGLAGVGRSSLSMTVQRVVNPIAALGFFSGGDLTIRAGAIIDGYDSREGSFDSQVDPLLTGDTTGRGGQVGSNGDVRIEAISLDSIGQQGGVWNLLQTTDVWGNIKPGPGGTVVLDPGVEVHGATVPRRKEAELPGIDVPPIPSEGSPSLGRGLLIDARDAAYDNLLVPTGAVLRIQGPATVVVANLEVEAGGIVQLDTTQGPITLHCLDNFLLREGSTLTRAGTGGEPTALLISTNISEREEAYQAEQDYLAQRAATAAKDGGGGAATEAPGAHGGGPAPPSADLSQPAAVELAASGEFHGLIYSPLAPLSVPEGMRVFGAVSSDGLTIEEGAHVSFDEALIQSSVGSSALPRLLSWRVVDLPDEPIVRSGIDPILRLRLAGYDPPPAAHAYKEECIAIKYLDGMGALNSYEGPYKDFNSARVVRVLGVYWYDQDAGEVPPAVLPPPPTTRSTTAALDALDGKVPDDEYQAELEEKLRELQDWLDEQAEKESGN